MSSYEERREEERRYHADVFYEVWRSGGNPDRIDYDRVQDRMHDGASPEQTASSELRRLRDQRERREQEEQEQYPNENDEQEHT